MINPLTLIDYYKADHRSQYPVNTELIYSNFTARGSRIPDVRGVVFFGLQYFIKRYLIEAFNTEFFSRSKEEIVSKYQRIMDNTLGKGAITTFHIEELHSLGYLPVEIRALPEGVVVPLRVPMLTIHNTLPQFYWVTNYLETIMSNILWGPITSATTAKRYRELLDKNAIETTGTTDFVQWQGHDFSFRGMFGLEAACLSGAGHLLSFTGTDTVPAIEFLEHYYKADIEKELVGASVPATEHSVVCAGGQAGEYDTFRRLITETYPKGIVSLVSDTWDLWHVITEIIAPLKAIIMARDGKVVIRPDSGDPADILCGLGSKYKKIDRMHSEYTMQYKYEGLPDEWYPYEADKGVIELLWDIFGGTTTKEGYKVLDSHIGAIYGDSITPDRAAEICERLKSKGFASINVVLGIGSYTYQHTTRDTYGMAMKATYCVIDGKPRDIFKDPVTDTGLKKSLKGLITVAKDETGDYVAKDEASWLEAQKSELKPVFVDGELLVDHSLAEIRARLAKQILKTASIAA